MNTTPIDKEFNQQLLRLKISLYAPLIPFQFLKSKVDSFSQTPFENTATRHTLLRCIQLAVDCRAKTIHQKNRLVRSLIRWFCTKHPLLFRYVFQPASVTPQEREKVMKQWSHFPELIACENACGQNKTMHHPSTQLSPKQLSSAESLAGARQNEKKSTTQKICEAFPQPLNISSKSNCSNLSVRVISKNRTHQIHTHPCLFVPVLPLSTNNDFVSTRMNANSSNAKHQNTRKTSNLKIVSINC